MRRKRGGLGKPETFNFLGFTFICGKTRAGKFQIKRKTRADRSPLDPIMQILDITHAGEAAGDQAGDATVRGLPRSPSTSTDPRRGLRSAQARRTLSPEARR
jgi:hypothetical protein